MKDKSLLLYVIHTVGFTLYLFITNFLISSYHSWYVKTIKGSQRLKKEQESCMSHVIVSCTRRESPGKSLIKLTSLGDSLQFKCYIWNGNVTCKMEMETQKFWLTMFRKRCCVVVQVRVGRKNTWIWKLNI